MKKYTKGVSCDERGQLVIPKEVRKELSIEEGTSFWIFFLENEGIILKRARDEILAKNDPFLKEIYEKHQKIGINRKNIDKTLLAYSRKDEGRFEEL